MPCSNKTATKAKAVLSTYIIALAGILVLACGPIKANAQTNSPRGSQETTQDNSDREPTKNINAEQILRQHGSFLTHAKWGSVWKPTVDNQWRPYTDGQWTLSANNSWAWVSNEPFGDTVYHYGRWTFDDEHRWIWVPGSKRGPAWVAWRQSDKFIGWAPLPPNVKNRTSSTVQLRTSIYDDPRYIHYWVFVMRESVTSQDLKNFVIPNSRNASLATATRPANAPTLVAFNRATTPQQTAPPITPRISPQATPRTANRNADATNNNDGYDGTGRDSDIYREDPEADNFDNADNGGRDGNSGATDTDIYADRGSGGGYDDDEYTSRDDDFDDDTYADRNDDYFDDDDDDYAGRDDDYEDYSGRRWYDDSPAHSGITIYAPPFFAPPFMAPPFFARRYPRMRPPGFRVNPKPRAHPKKRRHRSVRRGPNPRKRSAAQTNAPWLVPFIEPPHRLKRRKAARAAKSKLKRRLRARAANRNANASKKARALRKRARAQARSRAQARKQARARRRNNPNLTPIRTKRGRRASPPIARPNPPNTARAAAIKKRKRAKKRAAKRAAANNPG